MSERTVDCVTIHGATKTVPVSSLRFRPGAYGLIYRHPKVLLIRLVSNGKLCLPGGAIELGETALDALRREVREEAGIEVDVGKFLCFRENFHYYDPQDNAWHGLALCWECAALSDGFALDPAAGDPEEGYPEWVDVFGLKEEDCHGFTFAVIGEYWDRHRLWEYLESR